MRGMGWVVRIALAAVVAGALASSGAVASHTPPPSSVTIAGSLQSELGCSGDWQADCAATHLIFDSADDVWQATFSLPAGSWEYKAPLNNAWDENYGLHAEQNGANVPLNLGTARSVKFYYDHKSHWVTDNVTSTIAVAPGSFQSELGCPGDWDPGCLRSWLQDPDGDGIYSFETTALPAGSYEAKVAIDESWDVNYGQGGVQNGANIAFTVPTSGAKTAFRYDGATHVLSITAGHGHDNNVEWDGLRHDSRDTLYRTPRGAVPSGTGVTLRFRTFHDDVTSVRLRLFDVNDSAQRLVNMTRVASDVSCYQESLATERCDYWQARLPNAAPNNLWYRFILTDGSKTVYYADDTPALDGGVGAPSDDQLDRSWALMVHDPGFTAPAWAKDAVIYQIFPDRFRNGSAGNDPKTGRPRYDDPVRALPWGTLPEGFCRSYADASSNCPWRFDTTPPPWSPTIEGPRGRDYMGGDLDGVTQKLDYLKSLGVNTIYFNPIFSAKSNHRYDTANYEQIDPGLGTLKDFQDLVGAAKARGMRLILDGVFNHMSSDSPRFDRYHRYDTSGACESLTSPWRDWFTFTSSNIPCGSADYVGWFGFDSIPVLKKSNPEVQDYFVKGSNSIARLWLKRGSAGWRMDVSGDSSFPAGYWQAFRQVVKQADPNALIIGELWPKDTTTLRHLRGDIADSTMNYRLRDAVTGLLAPQGFDGKGLGDSGRILLPSEAASRLASIYEDYPRAAAYSLMNLLDSHDTPRALWVLTPGEATRAAKEQNAANLAAGKARLRLASLIQFTLPGSPTVYYGDEVGVTGADDPDDRRTYPWVDKGGSPDTALYDHYRSLAEVRKNSPALVNGDFRVLLADDAASSIAYGRKTGSQAAVVAVNRGGADQALHIPVAGYVPDGTAFRVAFGSGGGGTAAGGELVLNVPALGGIVVVTDTIDLTPPAAPGGLQVESESDGRVGLSWNGVDGAAKYAVYRSPVSGGGYVKAGEVTGTTFTDTGLRNAQTVYYVVRSLDGPGNESGNSNEVSALPHLAIGWANLQWPPSMTHTISAVNRTDNAYGQVWIDGVTNQPGPAPSLKAELGFGPDGSNPDGNAAWEWVEASFNVDAGNNDEFVASMQPDHTGTFDYAYRYTTTDGREWVYADLDGIGNGYSASQAGNLVVQASGDSAAPATPANLHVAGAGPGAIELAWDAVSGDPTLYGYEVLRGSSAGGPFTLIGTTTSQEFADTSVDEGATYYYVVRSVDTSFNRSANSAAVSATANLRSVTVVFNVTVPATTDATGRSVYIAGSLNLLDGGLPEWNPGGVSLTRVDATHWSVTLHGQEATQIDYKYTLGDWEHVEKDGSCGEIANRQLTLTYGTSGTQNVNDVIPNFRNVAPCGN
jgi:glycosidase/fibronectin type 3 domain-containing protein